MNKIEYDPYNTAASPHKVKIGITVNVYLTLAPWCRPYLTSEVCL